MSFEPQPLVSPLDKENLLSHKGLVIWMTGYSGSGKTTLAYDLEKRFYEEDVLTKVLDGNILRQGLNSDLGFDDKSRTENIRRTAELARQLASCGVVVICSLITPTNALRDLAEEIIGQERFILYHISTPLEICEKRDVKGHYANARSGKIENFTGISSVFEMPNKALFGIDTSDMPINESVNFMFDDLFPLLAI